MSPKNTEMIRARQLVEASLPPWAIPGGMRLSRESKIPAAGERGYTTKCAQRYDDTNLDIDAHTEVLAQHLLDGGNVGWVPPEGILIVDCDNAQAVAFVDARREKTTPIQKRRDEKQHFYFRYDPEEFHVYNRNGIKLDVGSDEPAAIDVKTCGNTDAKTPGGGYAVVPPSLHNEDADYPYTWKRKLPKDMSKIPAISLDLRNALAPFMTKGKKSERADNRHQRILRYQQRLVIEAREDSEDVRQEIIARTRAVAVELYGDEAERLAETVGSLDRMYDGATGHEHAFQGFSEDGSDEFFAVMVTDSLEGGLEYTWQDKGWLGWDGELWSSETPGSVKRCIGDYHRDLLSEAAIEQNDRRQENLTKWAYGFKGTRTVRRIYERMEINLESSLEEFDTDRRLVTLESDEDLGIEAQTLDLEGGQHMQPQMGHRITRTMGAPYAPGAQHPMVDRFLEESFPDEDTRRCVLMHLGVSMLGYLPVERFYFMHGKGASGKGTLATAALAVFGDYGTVADPATFSGNGGFDGSRNAPDLYALRGKRFVFVDEIAANRVLGSRIKNLTQDGTITAAGKYMKQTTFPITWTTWLAGNARPKIDPTDKGLLRRIVEIPMNGGAVDNDHIDWRVKDTLKNDPAAKKAFMWRVIEGLTEAREDYDFRPPLSAEMQAATDEWIELSDMVGPWLAERVEISNNMDDRELSSVLMEDYKEWMDDTHGFSSRREVPRATPNQFAECLKARDLIRKKMSKGWYWTGVKLRRPSDVLREGGHAGKLPN